MTLSIRGLNVTLSIIDTQHDDALYYADCSYAECRIIFIVMLSEIMLNVVMLNVVMLSVVAPGLSSATKCDQIYGSVCNEFSHT